ncbi:MAG: RagB/SusD family nutrient uptake outer membrane protein [Flavisolibacter sp.]|jgi:hypothetical protein
MKIKPTILVAVALMAIAPSCKKFLEYKPKGLVTDDQLNTATNVDKMVVAAYATLSNDDWSFPYNHMWPYGSVRGGDAYKGGGSVSDQGQYDQMEKFNLVQADNSGVNTIWTNIFYNVARVNDAIQRINKMTDVEYPNKKARLAEMRFLRGHYYFLLKILFKNIPYIDEQVLQDDRNKTGNNALNDIQLWDKIADEFQFGVDNLPSSQTEVGRPTKYAAYAYLAKTRLYEAYEQNATHQVVSINTGRLNSVVAACDAVINSGKYSLVPDFGYNWLYPLSENNTESIFAVQYSVNDGTPNGKVNLSSGLNYNMAAPYGCCSFHAPSQNLVNAFKTDPATGLPLIDTYNSRLMRDSIDFWTNGVDPRLDHTIGVPTHPFKYLPSFISQVNWQRVPTVYGRYTSMKEIAQYNSPAFKKVGAFFGSATNWALLKYNDVLLWKAEALIELGRQDEALPLINMIRNRAANSTGMLKYANGQAVSNYNCKPYLDGVNCTWTQDFARKALRFERRLEFALEGSHFFDLVRWGIAQDFINAYFATEKILISNLNSAKFTAGRDEYFPIPQTQITYTAGLYKQNPGY